MRVTLLVISAWLNGIGFGLLWCGNKAAIGWIAAGAVLVALA